MNESIPNYNFISNLWICLTTYRTFIYCIWTNISVLPFFFCSKAGRVNSYEKIVMSSLNVFSIKHWTSGHLWRCIKIIRNEILLKYIIEKLRTANLVWLSLFMRNNQMMQYLSRLPAPGWTICFQTNSLNPIVLKDYKIRADVSRLRPLHNHIRGWCASLCNDFRRCHLDSKTSWRASRVIRLSYDQECSTMTTWYRDNVACMSKGHI